ncbi:hypothetical protein AB7645_12900 [Bradyrhizobium sp. 956_D2_N1_5]|uniref:hypothetical protein n=1 Tax=unclassified Bradyrhizobium TaxID=2631580 RepID=UPI003F22B7FD
MTIYLALTVLAFRFGPWPWPVRQPEYVYLYLTAAIALFFIGSIGGTLASLPWRSPIASHRETATIKVAILVMVLSVLILSVARTDSLLPPVSLQLSRANYNYDIFVARNFTRGWWTYFEYAFALFSPLFFLALTGAIQHWRRLGWPYRIAYIFACLTFLLVYTHIGVNRGLFQLSVLLPLTFGLYYLFSGLTSRRTIWILLSSAVVGTALFLWIFVFFISFRDPASNIGHFTPLNLDAQRSGAIYGILPPALYPGYETVTRYLGVGYYGLSLALAETDYGLGLGLTNSLVILRKARVLLGDSWYFHTLLPVIEQKYDWSLWTTWHSAFTWFISDFGVSGSLFVVLMIGALYGLVWRNLLMTGSVVALSMFYLLNTMVLYFPANNQLLQSADTLLGFLVLFLIFVAGFFRLSPIRTSPSASAALDHHSAKDQL